MNCDGNFYYYVKDAEYGDRLWREHKHMEYERQLQKIRRQLPVFL